jgi:ribonuclease HI
MLKKQFYTVWKGRETGVFSTYSECHRSVSGFKGAVFKGFVTVEQAQQAFDLGYEGFLKFEQEQKGEFLEPLW